MNNIIGRVTKDLEPKTGGSGVHYVNFDVAENIGFGEKAKTVFHKCTIFGEEQVNRIVNACVKKGSLLQVVGEQTLDAYIKEADGENIAVPVSNIDVWHWGYVPASSGKAGNSEIATSAGTGSSVPSEDCDDGLPV